MTKGAAQFGVSPNGAIFTADGDGWTIRGPRVDVTRLSWLLDEAADTLQAIRRGKGGPCPRILDTVGDYAAVGSVAARRAS